MIETPRNNEPALNHTSFYDLFFIPARRFSEIIELFHIVICEKQFDCIFIERESIQRQQANDMYLAHTVRSI